MKIHITGHQIDVSAALSDYVSTKFERIVRHFDQLLDVHVILTVDKLVHEAEATLAATGTKIHATAQAGDMYAAIDELADKLDRQVKKHKEKITDHHRSDVQKSAQAS